MHRIAAILPSTRQTLDRTARKRVFGNLCVTLAIAMAAAPSAYAQAKRCDLQGRDTTISGNPTTFKRCLDLTSLDSATVTVPLNVTRIDNDGLSLCKSSVKTGGDADIVYVYDNSGSMRGPATTDRVKRRAWVGGGDTLFYFDNGSCSDTTKSGTVIFNPWNPAGTVIVKDTVARLVSNTGCANFSGDPYNTRGRAFRLGLQNQASRAPTSTAGIMSFSGTVADYQKPLVMNAANLTTIQGFIRAMANGGTNYTAPLDTSRNWLTNSAYTSQAPGRTKAIIFLSDGRPDNTNYIPLNPTTPTIYGIYLHRDTVGSARIKELSALTGGKFFLIPPSDPDSLIAVVDQILNIILLEYTPQTATVTNTSLSPAQAAITSPADFIPQPDGSWLMRMSDIIGLKGSASNKIEVTTTFKEKTSGALDTKTITFTLSTTLAASGTTQKIGNTQFGMTCYDKSSLQILNAAGARPAYLPDTTKLYQVRIRTSPSPGDSAMTASTSGIKGDAETPKLKPRFQTETDSIVFKNGFAMSASDAAGKTNGNGTIETGRYDSIIVTWTHPRDAQDVVSDTMRVRALPQNAQVWFSETSGGAATSSFPPTAANVYVVIKDQIPKPGRVYTAVITSETFALDKETVTLTESAPGSGLLVAQMPTSGIAKTPGDSKLQVYIGGDQLRVTYKDPVDGDSAQATAGFDDNVQEAASLEFTDAAGVPLAPGQIWSPENGKLFFSYGDDDLKGAMATKQITLTLAGRKYGATLATDHEKVAAAFTTSLTLTRGQWKGSIDLLDAFPPVDSNGKAETRFRGEATISAPSHFNTGIVDGNAVTDFLVIAYPDSNASITWKLDTTITPKTNEGLIITVTDQTFTLNAKDTVLVSVACTKSGDSVASFQAGEGPTATSGIYTTVTLVKDEGTPNLADKILSCLATDQIRIRYVDPVYGTLAELIIDEVGKPVANPAGRKFITSEPVTITTSTPGASIWYTLDGTTPSATNGILYTDPVRITVTDTLKAIAVKPGFKDSKVMTEIYTKESVASRLEILDENGNSIPDGVLTGSAKAIRIKLVTTQDNLTSAEVNALTRSLGDAETVNLTVTGSLGNAIELSTQSHLVSPGVKTAANDTIEAAGTDTLVVTWVNPFNPNDKAADTLIIKPAFVAAEVYFSTSNNGPRITEYPVGQDTVFIVVKTRPKDPAFTYQVVLTSSDGSGDREIVPLTEVSPGVFTGKMPVGTGAKGKGDNVIQVAAAGDQLTAVFTDPVYKVDYRGDAGFAQQVQEAAALDFIDENGALLAPADVWSPAKGKVYIRFSDDWNAGIDPLIQNKAVRFTLVNLKSGAQVGTDAETVNIALKSHTASRGIWEGSITLEDKATATNGNSILETYYRGELHAAVTPHNNAAGAGGADVGDDLVIAYPNQPAEIVIRDKKNDSAIDRETDKVEIIVRDQQVTKSGNPTLVVEVTCAQSGDKVSQVTLVWDGTQYVSQPPLDKGEVNSGTVDKNDAKLLCRDSDVLTVTYKDPVYNDTRTADAGWTDDTKSDIWYESTKDGSRITSAADAVDKDFRVVVQGKSPSREKADTILVVLTTPQGEKETFKAIETGAFTGLFKVEVPFGFKNADPAKENGKVDAKIVVGNRVNQVIATGEVTVGGATVKADISLLSSYDLISKAWMKDEDGDGRADHAYFLFDHKLTSLPNGLTEANWNQDGADYRKAAAAGQLSFVAGSDSTLVVADFSKSPFGANLTGVPEGKTLPTATFPDDNLFGAQKASLQDSVGPVPVTAVKRPSNGLTYNVTDTEKRFNPDTLVITVSEKLRTSTSFSQMLRFSKGCRDYTESVPLTLFSQPEFSADGLTITVIVDNSLEAKSPGVGDCIFLETDGRYTDFQTNRPAPLGVELTGSDPKLVIRGFRGFPPVAGIDAGNVGFTVSNHDPLADGSDYRKTVGADQTIEVIWVPPFGYDEKDPVGSLERIARDFNNPQAGERASEPTYPRAMPVNISTIQVITNTAYLARITIFDNLGHFVRSMTQAFGRNGELRNRLRTVQGGQESFLVWDMKDHTGNLVGQGVFVWKVNFTFEEKNKKSEVRYTRTGVLRQAK